MNENSILTEDSKTCKRCGDGLNTHTMSAEPQLCINCYIMERYEEKRAILLGDTKAVDENKDRVVVFARREHEEGYFNYPRCNDNVFRIWIRGLDYIVIECIKCRLELRVYSQIRIMDSKGNIHGRV